MGRLFLSLLLGGALFALLGWQFGLFEPPTSDDAVPGAGGKAPAPKLGDSLYPPASLQATDEMQFERKIDPIAVLGTMAVIDRPDVPAEIPGQLIFIGEEVPEGAAQVAGVAAFLAEPFDYCRVNHGERDVVKLYRRLYEDQVVYADQMLAMVNPAKSLGDLDTKRGKFVASKAISDGANSIAAEAEEKFKTAERLRRDTAIAIEEYRSAKLTRDKMWFDSIEKYEAWKLAGVEENMSRIIYKQHEIRNRVSAKTAIIQKIYKQRGEAVKELEPVMQLYSLERLMAEAQIDAEYGRRLRGGMEVTIEPSVVDSPPKIYFGHVMTVNCLAVTNDREKPQLVSGGEDRTVLLWNRLMQSPVREFRHPEAVKALAASPPGCPRNLIVTGCADGTLRLYDLQAKDNPLIKEVKEHSVAISALAFSPDGKYFASGAADGSIMLWTTDKVEAYYPFDEAHGVTDTHHGAITALRFTPQCKLVSASLDNSLRIWDLKEKGALLVHDLSGRTGAVQQVDVSADGRLLLFDQGKTLQLRSVDDGHMINTLKNPGGVIPFETLALFAPDASLMLTAGAGDGRLQLWRTPTGKARGFEVRQFAPRERSPVTCAAFAPLPDYKGEGTFAVSANKDGQIYLWPLPSRADVEAHPLRGRVRQINSSLNPSTRQISVGVEVPNPSSPEFPKGRLEPGRSVTIVIE